MVPQIAWTFTHNIVYNDVPIEVGDRMVLSLVI